MPGLYTREDMRIIIIIIKEVINNFAASKELVSRITIQSCSLYIRVHRRYLLKQQAIKNVISPITYQGLGLPKNPSS